MIWNKNTQIENVYCGNDSRIELVTKCDQWEWEFVGSWYQYTTTSILLAHPAILGGLRVSQDAKGRSAHSYEWIRDNGKKIRVFVLEMNRFVIWRLIRKFFRRKQPTSIDDWRWLRVWFPTDSHSIDEAEEWKRKYKNEVKVCFPSFSSRKNRRSGMIYWTRKGKIWKKRVPFMLSRRRLKPWRNKFPYDLCSPSKWVDHPFGGSCSCFYADSRPRRRFYGASHLRDRVYVVYWRLCISSLLLGIV